MLTLTGSTVPEATATPSVARVTTVRRRGLVARLSIFSKNLLLFLLLPDA
jgi:hypothetical protein